MTIPDLKIIQGDCREKLRDLADASVHCCVTSPPYFGLRDYGTAKWEGESADCDHKQTTARKDGGRVNTNGFHGSGQPDSDKGAMNYRDTCGKCGARRVDSQIGLEPTPDEYVAELVEVFRQVRRVLRDDGTLWLNLGDSYANDGKWGGHTGGLHQKALHGSPVGRGKRYTGLKPKDLIGIPWMVAFALRADGWWLRRDIIWHKPTAMPESVEDRPTTDHEYVFLLSKSQTYYYDFEAIKEPVTGNAHARGDGVNPKAKTPGVNSRVYQDRDPQHPQARKSRQNESWSAATNGLVEWRNKRSVWSVPSAPYSEAHFATYPPKLIQPCILAGCPAGGVVLDPFAGSGTTGKVALENGRSAILIELNPEYVKLIEKRCRVNLPLMFEQGAVV